MEKKKNNSKKITNTVKTTRVDKRIKEEIKEEQDNKKIIIVALILALLIGVFAYWRISTNNESEQKKSDNDKNEVIDEITDSEIADNEIADKIDEFEELEFVEYIKQHIKPIKIEKEEEETIYYSIKFESNGGEEIEDQILANDEVTSLILPVREGWVFQGWYKDSEFNEEFTFGDVITEDITVYAKWGKYISYMYGETLYEKETVVSENDVIPFLSEEKTGEIAEGYVLGWFVEQMGIDGQVINSFEILENTLLTEDIYSYFEDEEIILQAKLLEKFNIEFFEDELSLEALYTQEVVEGREIPFDEVGAVVSEKFDNLESYGWYYLDEELIKWNVALDQKADKAITKLYLDETYTLIYTEEPDEDTIITDEVNTTPNGNIILKEEQVVQNSQIKEENIFKTLEKEGYEFIGWFLVDELSGEVTEEMFTEETIIDGNKIYIARWKEIVKEEIINDNTEIVEEDIINNDTETVEEEVQETNTEVEQQMEIIEEEGTNLEGTELAVEE